MEEKRGKKMNLHNLPWGKIFFLSIGIAGSMGSLILGEGDKLTLRSHISSMFLFSVSCMYKSGYSK